MFIARLGQPKSMGFVLMFLMMITFVTTASGQDQEDYKDTIYYADGRVWKCQVLAYKTNIVTIARSPVHGGGRFDANLNDLRGLRGPRAYQHLPPGIYEAINSYVLSIRPITTPIARKFRFSRADTVNYMPIKAPISNGYFPYRANYTAEANVELKAWQKRENSIDLTGGIAIPIGLGQASKTDFLETSDFEANTTISAQLQVRSSISEHWQVLVLGGLAEHQIETKIPTNMTLAQNNLYSGAMFMAYASVGPSYRAINSPGTILNLYGTVGYVHNSFRIERRGSDPRSSVKDVLSRAGANALCYTLGANLQIMIPQSKGWYFAANANIYYAAPTFGVTLRDPGKVIERNERFTKYMSILNGSIGVGFLF
jgi:hypothetical protein